MMIGRLVVAAGDDSTPRVIFFLPVDQPMTSEWQEITVVDWPEQEAEEGG